MLHDLPPEWLETTIGQICRVRRGASPRPIDSAAWFADEGPGWVRIIDVTRSDGRLTSTEQRLSDRGAMRSVPVHPGQLIMSICATVGVPVVLEIEACIHDGFVVLDHYEDKADTQFLYHFLKFMTQDFRSMGQTGTQANVNTGIVNAAKILLPPVSEQRRIAEILDTIDEAIQKTEALIEKLKAMKQGLLHDLLTRGLDENGKLRDPKTHLEQFKDSPLGRIPRKWNITRLTQVCDHITKGATPTTYGYSWVETGILFLRSECVEDGRFTLEGAGFITNAAHQGMSRSVIKGGDILMTITGNIGRVCRYPLNMPEANINQHIARIRTIRKDEFADDFVLWALQDPRQKNLLELEITGLAYPQIGLAQVQAIPLPKPKMREQNKIANILNAHDARISVEEQYLNKLKLQKKGLMHDLLTGKVRAKAGSPKEKTPS